MLAFFTPFLQKFGVYLILGLIVAGLGAYVWYDITSKNKEISVLQANVATLQANYNNALAANKADLAQIKSLQESNAFITQEQQATSQANQQEQAALIKDIQIIENLKNQEILIKNRNGKAPAQIISFNNSVNSTINCGFQAIVGKTKLCP